MSQFGLGYRHDLERREEIIAGSHPFAIERTYTAVEIDPRPWFPILNQGNVGSCRGHSLVAAGRVCAVLASGERELDLDEDGKRNEPREDGFSANWAYRRTQQYDRISGDSGSTIAGGIQTGMDAGLILERDWPYSGRYESSIPSATERAKRFKFGRYTRIRSAQEAFDWLQTGQGCLDWGTVWPLSFEAGCVVRSLSSRADGGGHATCPMGVIRGATLKRDVTRAPVQDDEWVFVVANSHSTQAQHNGFYYVTMAGFDSVLKHSWTEVIGWSDMPQVKARKIDWTKAFAPLKGK